MLTLNDGRTELWQWDTGRTLAVDADCSQVHFSNKVFGRSIDVDVADGVAIIPDILLQTDKELNVWAFVGTAENGYTKISKTFKVIRRNKPADYVFTPQEQITLKDATAILEEAKDVSNKAIESAKQAEDSSTQAAKSADAAADSASAAAGSAVSAGNSASAAARSERASGESEVKAAESEKAAKESEQAAAQSAAAADNRATDAAKSSADADRTANSIKDSMAQISENKEEVSKLKEDFSQLNIIGGVVEPTLNWTQGKYVNNSTNAITNGSNQLYITDYLTIPNKCYEILITKIHNLSVAWTVAFYDVSKTFVSGLSSSTFGTFTITESDIPENAKYIIATHYDDGTHSVDNITVEFHTFKRFADIESELTVLNDEMPVRDESYSNILDVASTFTDNKFINDKGNVVTNANFCLIDGYYPVKPNTIYKLYRGEPSLYSNAGHNWTWWDENKNFISYVLSGSAVTSPANAAFLRFGVYISNTGSVTHATFDATKVIITEDGKPYFDTDFSDSFVTRPTLKGLKWIGIGDSITEDNFRATYHYHDYIKAETGLTFVNMGVSGTGYKAEGSGDKAFYKRVPNMATDADIITIFGGVNDVVLSNADIGTETDTGTETICGCVNNTLDVIETLYPAHMPIGIISPLPCACVDTVVNLHPLQNPADDTCRMAVFVEQLRLICKHRGIPFLDLFHQSNLRPWKEECREKYFSCDSAKSGDGLHPNGYGHRLIYRQIMDFVKKLAMN